VPEVAFNFVAIHEISAQAVEDVSREATHQLMRIKQLTKIQQGLRRHQSITPGRDLQKVNQVD